MFFKTASSVHFSLPWNSWQSLSWSRTYISPTSFFKVLELQVCHHTQQLCVILRDDTILNRMWVIELASISTLHTLPTTCHLALFAQACCCSTTVLLLNWPYFTQRRPLNRRTKDGGMPERSHEILTGWKWKHSLLTEKEKPYTLPRPVVRTSLTPIRWKKETLMLVMVHNICLDCDDGFLPRRLLVGLIRAEWPTARQAEVRRSCLATSVSWVGSAYRGAALLRGSAVQLSTWAAHTGYKRLLQADTTHSRVGAGKCGSGAHTC